MDRLDYLSRDSFFTGVQEGIIGCARILKMLNVSDDNLVLDIKGLYSIENYLTSRRSMYWQVYLHKTVVACEKVLVNLLRRAKVLVQKGVDIFAPPAMRYFLYNNVDRQMFENDPQALHYYAILDDNDIWSAIKVWMENDDKILSLLASNLINRHLFKVEIHDEPIQKEYVEKLRKDISKKYNVTYEETEYLYSINTIEKNMYDFDGDGIKVLMKDGSTQDICEISELLNAALMTKQKPKYYLSFQRI